MLVFQAGGPPLVGQPRLLIRCSWPLYLEAVFCMYNLRTFNIVVTRDPINMAWSCGQAHRWNGGLAFGGFLVRNIGWDTGILSSVVISFRYFQIHLGITFYDKPRPIILSFHPTLNNNLVDTASLACEPSRIAWIWVGLHLDLSMHDELHLFKMRTPRLFGKLLYISF